MEPGEKTPFCYFTYLHIYLIIFNILYQILLSMLFFPPFIYDGINNIAFCIILEYFFCGV